MEKCIYVVRHGESNSNSGGIILGPVAVLTEQGKREALTIAERMKRIGVDAIVSSPYPRAADTAAAIAQATALPIEQSDLFIEWKRPSVMMGMSWRDPKTKQLDDDLLKSYASSASYRHSDEETFAELKTRAERALAFLKDHAAPRIAVASHGIFMRALFGAAVLGDSFTAAQFERLFHHLRIGNTGITVLRFDDNRSWVVETWNDSAHLD